MVRKLLFVLCAMSLTLGSCGRQVTPNRTGTSAGGLQPGYMQIKFNTSQAMDFVNVWYIIAINTSGPAPGTNGEPYPVNGNSIQNWVNYSFEFIVYQLPGTAGPQVQFWQFVTQAAVGGGTVKVPVNLGALTPQQLQLVPNCNGSQTQFCLTIDRHIFSGLPQTSPSPSSSPSSSPSASPSASASPSPSPTASGVPPAVSGTWYINWFTVAPGNDPTNGGTVIDAPGPQGASDQTWLPPNTSYNTATSFDFPWTSVPPPGWPQVSNQAAQISGGEVLNVP